ncbi:MAG: SIMPL domain-containing protein [Nocardioides sp.]|nr:SIMPL domain-containing protein [Nocardioides sp.]
MNANVTVSVRGLLVAALVAMALVVAYLLGGSGGGTPAAQAADDRGTSAPAERPRLLTMTGTGEAGAVPDQLSFGLRVTLTRVDLDEALAAANASMSRVLRALDEYDVARSDVQTTGLSMTPVYAYHDYSPPTITGYRVSERASVLVKELAQGGKAVSAAVAAGGNAVRVGDIRLLVGDSDAVLEKARDAAVQEATAKAQQYAEASGQTLGDVVTLREVHARPLPSPYLQFGSAVAGRAAMDLSAVPIRAGRDKSAVTVRVVWELS